ncbi:MAG: hypothetical protein IKL46_03245 [Clostridia bacterium]|nr:hypothetical protein [Clostridia bacterium]
MKSYLNKNAKRALSLVLSIAMLIGTLFVANVGVNIDASAQAAKNGKIVYWNTTTATAPTKTEGTNQYGNPIYIIETAEELNYICTKIGATAKGKTYKIADDIQAFILQPESWASKDSNSNGTPDIMEMNGYQETKDYFESLIESGTTPNNWLQNGETAFCGDFDGNGVEIYGLYADGTDVVSGSNHYSRQSAALFPNVDGGGSNPGGNYYDEGYKVKDYKYDTVGSLFTNFAVRNSYYKTYMRVGAVFGTTYYVKGGSVITGTVTLEGIEVTGCYMYQQDSYYDNTTHELKTGTAGTAEMGVLFGSAGNDPTKVNNCFIRDNYVYHSGDDMVVNNLFGQNFTKTLYDSAEKTNVVATLTASVTNSIVLGASPLGSSSSPSQDNYSNVYTDRTTTYTQKVTRFFDGKNTVKGSAGMAWMPGLAWGTEWFAVEGRYPSPIKPADYNPSITAPTSLYSGGDGTKERPFIIRTADQLYKMVHEYNCGTSHRTITNGSTVWDFYEPYYYKVADDVKEIYLNDVKTKDEVVALGQNGNVWSLTAPATTGGSNTNANNYGFFGNFDGNGVTIYGLISTDGNGFVYRLKGNATIKNVNFEAAYVTASGNAAVVTTRLGTWSIINDDCHTIANVNVRNSYISSSRKVSLQLATSSDKDYNKNYNEKDGTYIVTDTVTLTGDPTTKYTYHDEEKGIVATETATYANGSIYKEYKLNADKTTTTHTKTVEYYSNTYFINKDYTKLDDKGNPTTSTFYYVFRNDRQIYKTNAGGPAGIVSTSDTTGVLTVANCLFDGYTSDLVMTGTDLAVNNAAGILSSQSDTNNFEISNCVSLGNYGVVADQIIADKDVDGDGQKEEIYYNRLVQAHNFGVSINNCYTTDADPNTAEFTDIYSYLKETIRLTGDKQHTKEEMAMLNWSTTWTLLDESTNDEKFVIPMVNGKAYGNIGQAYSQLIVDNDKAALGRPYNGNYSYCYDLTGSGTESDPYLIENALQLARAIAFGGQNLGQKLYYKLTCDIDLENNQWIDQTYIKDRYNYAPFIGTLDGANHTITGLSASDEQGAGLIPVLDGGTVKNLHIRNSYAGSVSPASAGVIAGVVNSGSTIENCSVEGSSAVNSESTIIGNWAAASSCVSNSYIVLDTVNDDKTVTKQQHFSEDIDRPLYPAANAEWYKGPDGIIRHLAAAKAHTITDVDADGEFGNMYTTTDVVALRRNLLKEDGYLNIYGDVNNDGKVNITDLVTIRREMVGTEYDIREGFWRAFETNQVKIYYAENDTYDMARKLELYLEGVLGDVDIVKLAGPDTKAQNYVEKYATIPETNAIVITKTLGTIDDDATKATYDDYSVTFDKENNIINISGGCFTAVEQAVLDLIEKGYLENKDALDRSENFTGSILSATANKGSYNVGQYNFTTDANADEYKSYRWVDKNSDGIKDEGEIYFYAWGDEFESDSKTSFSRDKWLLSEYRTESEVKNDDGTYSDSEQAGQSFGLESANLKDTDNLWVVNDGRLTINRGVRVTASDKSNATKYPDYVPVELENDEINDFGSHIDSNDTFVDPGSIKTFNSMLFKYGYAEMRASLPSDGHAFPAWWILTGPARTTNSGIDSTLYDKVYTLNNGNNSWAYDGTTNKMNGSKPTTYKYQIPEAHLEFDIVELMQASANTTGTSDYRDYFQATIHKIYSANVYNNETDDKTDDVLYLPNWSNGTYQTWCTYNTSGGYATSNSNLKVSGANLFTSQNDKPYLNNYNNSNYNDLYPSSNITWSSSRTGSLFAGGYKYSYNYGVGTSRVAASFSATLAKLGKNFTISTGTTSSSSNTYSDAANNVYFNTVSAPGISASGSGNTTVNDKSHVNLHKTYTYGFTWDATATTYTLAIYCDLNENGVMEASTEKIFEINEKTGYESKFGTDPTVQNGTDAATWNQYGYILLDNAFYTALNESRSMYTTLGVDKDAGDKITFDIEYIRVYQEDGKRDLVTDETEDFNNSNHFGY